MKIPFVDLEAQYTSIKPAIDQAIKTVVGQTTFIGGGIVKDFESVFAVFAKRRHCISCANGTDAIEIALKALGIGPGDEVIVPALTWISTGGAVNSVGAEPVFVDVLPDERTLDPALLEGKITPKTRAVIPVHLYGLPARMKEICGTAKKHGLAVVEDCAQAHGATIGEKQTGTFGDIATYSFYPGKNLGAYGDAGAIVTNDRELAGTCRMLCNHGQIKKHDHRVLGRNSRLDTLQASILLAKLPHLNHWTKARMANAAMYDERLKTVKKPMVPEGSRHVYHLYVIQVANRDEMMNELKENGIGCAVHYPVPLPLTKPYAYKKHTASDFPVADKICKGIISLPIYAELTSAQIEIVCDHINLFR